VQAVQTVVSLVLARILAPEDYGLMAMAVAITGFVQIFQNPGLAHALIQRPEVDDKLLSSLFFFSLGIAACLAGGLFAAGSLIAAVYQDARVPMIAVTVSLGFVFSAAAIVPFALLNREMAFAKLGLRDLIQAVVTGVTAFALAFQGWGVWALAWCGNAGLLAGAVALYVLCPWRPRLHFSWREVRSILPFSGNLTGSQIFTFVSRKADDFLIGVFLGAAPLGYYSLAYRFLLLPREAVTNIFGRVLFPAFSRMRDDPARLQAAYLRACGAIAFVTFPLMLGLTAVAEPFVVTLLGERWLPAAPLIMVLAPAGMLQSVGVTVNQLFMAAGRADLMLRLSLVSGVLYVGAFLAGLPWGVFGVAVSCALCGTLLLAPSFWLAFRLFPGLSGAALLRTLWRQGLPAAAMATIVWLVRSALEAAAAPPAEVLAVSVLCGIVIQISMSLLLRPPELLDLLRLVPLPWQRWAYGAARTQIRRIRGVCLLWR
jgi:PST family polysaccharide transporter